MLGRKEISELIPHDGNMVLLDSVTDWSETQIVCSTTSHLQTDNPLRRGGRLSAVCGVEYGAQAMAVHGGLITGKGRLGFLTSLRNVRLNVERLDDLGGELIVKAEMIHRVSNAFAYNFSLSIDRSELVGGRATVFVK